jgi:hypothetical protein
LVTEGNVTLGNASSDELTINAALASFLQFTGGGRVPLRTSVLAASSSSANPVVTSYNCLVCNTSTQDQTITLSDVGASDGDFMLLVKPYTSNDLQLNLPGAGYPPNIRINANQGAILAVRASGTWWCVAFSA